MENVNHKNYKIAHRQRELEAQGLLPAEEPVLETEDVEEAVEETEESTEEVEEVEEAPTREELQDLTKSEQQELLKEFGLSKKEIKKLHFESDRVDKLVELNAA